MANSWCYKCQTKSPPSPRKNGWHSISSASGLVRCCPECATSLGLPPPTQLPPRKLKDVLQHTMSRRELLNKLVNQGYVKKGMLTSADKEPETVIIDGAPMRILCTETIPYGLRECAVTSFSGLTDEDKAGPVYYRMDNGFLSWFIWAYQGRKVLFLPVKVKMERSGKIMLEA